MLHTSTDDKIKWEAIELAVKDGKQLSVLNLSKQKEFCKYMNQDDKLLTLFQHQSLRFVTEIHLNDCDLPSLPDWSLMENLIHADVSGNAIDTVPPSNSIQKLNISGTQITTLALEKDHFPKLTDVEAGSDFLEFISFDLLNRATVSIDQQFHDSLFMPPFSILNDKDKLQRCLTRPERYLSYVDSTKIQRASQWLMCESDFVFSELDLSGRSDLCSDPESLFNILQGSNVAEIKILNLDACEMSSLPELGHLRSFRITAYIP